MSSSSDHVVSIRPFRVIDGREVVLPGGEYCRLWHDGEKWHLDGTLVCLLNHRPTQVHYQVRCTTMWDTEEVDIELEAAGERRALHLSVDDQRRWWSEGREWWSPVREMEVVQGCRYVDLGITASARTMPIRRLGLAIGQSGKVSAAWIKFPEMEVRLVEHRYTRLEEQTYRYEGNHGRTVADLKVNSSGMIYYYCYHPLPIYPPLPASERRRWPASDLQSDTEDMQETKLDSSAAAPLPLTQTILWNRLEVFGSEYCMIRREGDKWHLQGTILLGFDRGPAQVQYYVKCNAQWETDEVEVHLDVAGEGRALRLTVDEARRWWSDEQEIEGVRGCVDVALGITPSTKTLAVRRLGLAVGQAEDIRVAWVIFPELEVRLLPQRYTRLDEHTYHSESDDGSFMADFDVDSSGIVSYFPGRWECSALV